MFKHSISLIALVLFVAIVCLNARTYAESMPNSTETTEATETIVLAGGCFWGVEAVFQHTKGVIAATSGYAGGKAETATYHMVSNGNTGHAEAVEVTYDPSRITLERLLDIYFTVAHNPTQLNYQGPDYGTQYRSAVFYSSPLQQEAVQQYITTLKFSDPFSDPVVTKLEPLEHFYPAEDYHQNYVALHPNNGYIIRHDAPKLVNLQQQFPEFYVK